MPAQRRPGPAGGCERRCDVVAAGGAVSPHPSPHPGVASGRPAPRANPPNGANRAGTADRFAESDPPTVSERRCSVPPMWQILAAPYLAAAVLLVVAGVPKVADPMPLVRALRS